MSSDSKTVNYKNCLVITSLPNENDKVDGTTNKPKIRHKNIMDTIRDKYDFFVPKENLNGMILKELNVHCPDYIDFLENAWVSFSENYDKDYDPHEDLGLVPYHFCYDRNSMSYKKIPQVWKRAGYFCHDIATPIYENTYKIALMSANNSYMAAKLINTYDLIYCLNHFPGHHVTRSSYGGYCYLNNAAICAKQLQKLNHESKIAILDIDAHHNNGAQDIFYEDNNVYTLSIHMNPNLEYPSFTGFPEENTETNKNYILNKGYTSEDYLQLLNSAIEEIIKFNPWYVIINFGGDTYALDPDISRICMPCGLQLEDYIDIGKELKRINKKIIINQEGGYCMEKMGIIVDNFLSGLIN